MQNRLHSLYTKQAIAAELRRQASAMGAERKVTVRSLVQGCNVNRNTFYYHFSNMEELILWTLRSDLERLREFEWSDGHGIRVFTVNYLDENRGFLNYAFRYIGFERFRGVYRSVLDEIVWEYITNLEPERQKAEGLEERRALASAFAEMLTALIVWYFRDPSSPSRVATGTVFDASFTYAIPGMLKELN